MESLGVSRDVISMVGGCIVFVSCSDVISPENSVVV